ncbi:MAG TPA: hypothetical protein VMH22_09550 [bacterium]|nr:hypothetical protein [bacterium]
MPADSAPSRRWPVVGFAVAMAGLCLLAGCKFPTTVYGRLALTPGSQGDVRLARIELHDSVAWDSAPAYSIAPESGGSFSLASFEFPAVAPGPYYILAWVDKNGDGKVSDGDLTGVYGGQNRPGWPGKPVDVYQGWTVDAGNIEMATYEVLAASATGFRSPTGDTTTFRYSFNHDFQLNSLAVTFPGQPALPDPAAPGEKVADSTYYSGGWSMGGQMPTGMHELEFRGIFRDSSFVLRVAVSVN